MAFHDRCFTDCIIVLWQLYLYCYYCFTYGIEMVNIVIALIALSFLRHHVMQEILIEDVQPKQWLP